MSDEGHRKVRIPVQLMVKHTLNGGGEVEVEGEGRGRERGSE